MKRVEGSSLRQRAWPARKFKTFSLESEAEAKEGARRSARENVALVLGLQDRLGLKCDSLRFLARTGRLKVIRKNWKSRG